MTIKTLPFALEQNPAPNPASQGQAYQADKAALVQNIMAAFRSVLPSNYVAATNGPWYSLQFQAIAEQLAAIQISAGEIALDCNWDFTRPDFLWELLGNLVFPTATSKSGIPVINGDVAYRDFLRTMINLLLQGATKTSIELGLEALNPEVTVYVLERYLETPPRDSDGAYTIQDQFVMDILTDAGNQFPGDLAVLDHNVNLVLQALKPAHVLYSYSTLFRDDFAPPEALVPSWDLDQYGYDDTRRYTLGAREIAGELSGSFASRRDYFSDPSKSFEAVQTGAVLTIRPHTNTREAFRVKTTRALLFGTDPVARAYVTSGGLTGMVVAENATDLLDPAQNWGLAEEGETITILTGPNSGAVYRLGVVLGSNGGSVGGSDLVGIRVRLSPTILVLTTQISSLVTAVSYTVTVDRLGGQTLQEVTSEDVTDQFWV